MEYASLFARPYGCVHLFGLPSVERFVIREPTKFLHALEHEPSDVNGEQRRGVVQALAQRQRPVRQAQRNGDRPELRRCVDVDETVLPHDENRQPRRTEVLLRASKDYGVFAEMGNRARHERGRVVADEREEAAALAGQAPEGEGRLGGGVWGELDAIDGLVVTVVDEGGRGREGELAVRRHVVEGHAVFGVPAGVDRDVHAGATAEASGLLVRLFAPRARDGVVHDALVVGDVRIE